MSRQLMQKRYIGGTQTNLSNLTIDQLHEAENFLGSGTNTRKAISIGVQAPEKTIFYINNEKIIMGRTGIFEWDIENIIGEYIESFYFDADNDFDTEKNYIVDFYLEEE